MKARRPIVQDGPVSPVSRGRKKAKSRRTGQRPLAAVPAACDCPDCSGSGSAGPEEVIQQLLDDGAHLRTVEDPLDAEIEGAGFLALGELAGDAFAAAFAEGIVPELAEAGTPEALAILLALGAVADGPAATAAARRLIESGVPAPAWFDELNAPVTLTTCRRFGDPEGLTSMLVCCFERAGRSQGFVLQADHTACGAAANVGMFLGDQLDEVLQTIPQTVRETGLTMTGEVIDPAEFRWQVENALDARRDHDRDEGNLDLDDESTFHPVALLLRARMRTLPHPPRPPAKHEGGNKLNLASFVDRLSGTSGGGSSRSPGRAVKLPAKRKKSAGPAPIYQIKVSLRGAKPPIWRRLELPADTGLADLHGYLQTAFGWDDGHMHAFETPFGMFGVADRELAHLPEKPVTLEQVAPGAGDRLDYVYDFGDDWVHEIQVEKVLDRQDVAYPRCTGGRRAAPPEDCGGIWGYQHLVEVLGDPGHPDHEEQLEWLGLESAAEFDPARFDAAEVTRSLTGQD
jgi:hypothetical protein